MLNLEEIKKLYNRTNHFSKLYKGDLINKKSIIKS